MNILTYSNKGTRNKNEDRVLSENMGDDTTLHMIADGMGGYEFGERAAGILVDTFRAVIADELRSTGLTNIESSINNACDQANKSVEEERRNLSAKLGATFAAVLIIKDKIFAFWMGDARVYQYDDAGSLLFQSKDHSLVNELLQTRVLSASQIRKYESIVTRCIMGEPSIEPPQIENLHYSSQGKLLICSDGLYKQIEPETLINMDADQLKVFLDAQESSMKDNYSMILVN